ncbi:hypothetical protein [Pseudonocardia phyllosphaerae]|uniref:hypothetical protein n=1 Tax=Pseudonocardia phyllosphaerae TaxID=3390502 RepID=UPI00397AC8A5
MSPPRVLGRRALLVGAGAAALVAAGTSERWLPSPVVQGGDDPEALRRAVLGGVVAHTGTATATGRLGLPAVPKLEAASTLLSTTTRIRVQVATAGRWRVDGLTPVGEVDTYRDGSTEHTWDYGAQRLTTVTPLAPVRLPRASDLAPADLARRLLRVTASEPVTALPGRRVAGLDAAGLRISPADPDTTVRRIDVWAVPSGGGALPVAVQVVARTGTPGPGGSPPDPDRPLVETAFDTVELAPPPQAALAPAVPPGAERVRARPDDLAGTLRGLDAPDPPDTLSGRDRVPLPETGLLPGVAVYGAGVGRFVLVPTARDVVDGIVRGSGAAGGVGIEGLRPTREDPDVTAARVATPLLTLVVARRGGRGYLLAGTVVPRVLERAARELVGDDA